MSGVQVVGVELADRSYSVVIGSGVRRELPTVLRRLAPTRVAVVSARPPDMLSLPDVATEHIAVREGEHIKSLAHVEQLCRRFAQLGLHRDDVVVSCGGGTVSDAVGMAAALYHRGLPVVHLPTSLLAQVDASVGGKTAVNLPEGKNLIGTYWQPAAVLCDTDFLATLPRREWLSGFGEIARCHFLGAGELRHLPLQAQITASVALKARVVAEDERDAGRRNVLNYGHTLGHALEVATGFVLRHGEAVAIGTVFAAELAGRLGRISSRRVAEHREVVAHYGLPADLPDDCDVAQLISLMTRDKKAGRTGLAFVLDGPGGVEVVRGVPESTVRTALEEMRHAPCPTT
jgi:5-deoxy-5-amino-3-dehydroquinate synthase